MRAEFQLGKNQGNKRKSLHFECDLVEAMKSGIFICGAPHSGKSTLGFIIADLLMKNDVIVHAIDPSQAWEQSSLPNILHINYPMRFKLKDEAIAQSTVFDISLLSYSQRLEFTEKFCKTLMDVKKKSKNRPATFVFFEEGHLYFPPGSMRSLKRFTSSVELVTIGRNFNVRYGIITQFPTMIDKLLIKSTKQRYFGWLNEQDDLCYVGRIVGKKMAKELPKLNVGEFIYLNVGGNGSAKKVKVPLWKLKSIP